MKANLFRRAVPPGTGIHHLTGTSSRRTPISLHSHVAWSAAIAAGVLQLELKAGNATMRLGERSMGMLRDVARRLTPTVTRAR